MINKEKLYNKARLNVEGVKYEKSTQVDLYELNLPAFLKTTFEEFFKDKPSEIKNEKK